jgi:hypothetical protein
VLRLVTFRTWASASLTGKNYMKKTCIFAIWLFSASSLAVAAPFAVGAAVGAQAMDGPKNPSFVLNNMPESPRVDRVLKSTELDPERRKMLWQGKTVDKDGYLRVKSSIDYLNLPTAFAKHPRFVKNSESSRLMIARGDIEPVGKLDEDQHRVSHLFAQGNTSILFTTWNYKAAGAVYSISEEFLNQKVAGQAAVLSLSYAEKSNKALWKLTWWDKGVQYELYVSDVLDGNGNPKNKPHQIVHLADLALKRVGK